MGKPSDLHGGAGGQSGAEILHADINMFEKFLGISHTLGDLRDDPFADDLDGMQDVFLGLHDEP